VAVSVSHASCELEVLFMANLGRKLQGGKEKSLPITASPPGDHRSKKEKLSSFSNDFRPGETETLGKGKGGIRTPLLQCGKLR